MVTITSSSHSVQLRLSLGESAQVWYVTAHASARASGLSNYQRVLDRIENGDRDCRCKFLRFIFVTSALDSSNFVCVFPCWFSSSLCVPSPRAVRAAELPRWIPSVSLVSTSTLPRLSHFLYSPLLTNNHVCDVKHFASVVAAS